MIVMLDTNQPLDVCEKEIGCEVEQLITPLTRRLRQRPNARFSIDNGAFANFNAEGFMNILEREKPNKDLCRFVAVPDVVGSARRTLELFDHWWSHKLAVWPLALVAQDGQEDLPIPWNQVKAIFIGGTTQWKMGRHAKEVIKAAKAMNKWVHIGRVNTPGRFEYFSHLGADSIDGTGISRYSWMRDAIYQNSIAPRLFDDDDLEVQSDEEEPEEEPVS